MSEPASATRFALGHFASPEHGGGVGRAKNFYHDITTQAPMAMNEGYTVTHYSLQALYYLGCQTVYIIGRQPSTRHSQKLRTADCAWLPQGWTTLSSRAAGPTRSS